MARGVSTVIPRNIIATPYGTQRQLELFEARLSSNAASQGGALVGYDNSASGMTAASLQAAVDESITNLASTAAGDGAALIGTEDAGSYFATSTVEDNLQEIGEFCLSLFPYQKFTFWDDFAYKALDVVNGSWSVFSGTDPQALDPAIAANALRGHVRLVTGDDATTPTLAVNGSELVGAGVAISAQNGGLTVEYMLQTDAITDVVILVGLTDNAAAMEEAFTISSKDVVAAVATNAVAFVFNTGAATAEWFACAVDTNVVDAGSAPVGQAPVAGTWARLTIGVSSDGATVTFGIDGTVVATLTGDAGISPTAVLYPYVAAYALGAASRIIDADYAVVRATRP